MRITKCDICKKTITPHSEILQLAYNRLKTFDTFEFCADCAKPVIKILRDKKLIKIEDKKDETRN